MLLQDLTVLDVNEVL